MIQVCKESYQILGWNSHTWEPHPIFTTLSWYLSFIKAWGQCSYLCLFSFVKVWHALLRRPPPHMDLKVRFCNGCVFKAIVYSSSDVWVLFNIVNLFHFYWFGVYMKFRDDLKWTLISTHHFGQCHCKLNFLAIA